MLVVMKNDATEEQVKAVINEIERMGFKGVPMPGAQRTAICIIGNKGPVEDTRLRALEGVKETIPVTKPYKLVSRETHAESTAVPVGNIKIGGGEPVIMAGPCAVESEEQALTIARIVKTHGAQVYRGGAFKPRTSPYSFQGLGEKGLKILQKVRQETGLLIITEATDTENLGLVEKYTDIIQIGARNMQNYSLLRLAGQSNKAVVLKRGMAATIDEWLMAAEYIMSEGNPAGHPLRAGDTHVFGQHAQHARPQRDTVDKRGQPPAGNRRPQPCGRETGLCHSPIEGGDSGGSRRPARRGAPRPRTRAVRRNAVALPQPVRGADERDRAAQAIFITISS